MTTQTTAQMLDDRYGRTARGRRFWIVLASIGLAAAIAIAAWFAVESSTGSADAATTGFQTVDRHSVTVSFQVSTPPGTALACILEAQDENHGVVGWRVVEYDAATTTTRAFTETVPTVAAATTGLVNSCWVP